MTTSKAVFLSSLAALVVTTVACQEALTSDATQQAPAAVQVGAENVVTVTQGTVVVGPIISGELKPAREATVRAEIGGSVVQVAVEEAQPVRRGALLARIETRTLEDARQSAMSALRSAEALLAVSRREAERTERLVEAGALAARELDLARSTVASAEASVADAKSRLASADRTLADTAIGAPFAGIVSVRSVNLGDVVTPGAELVRIIDPSSMRLEASVPSDDLSLLRVGAAVDFNVRGYNRPFTGRIERIGAEADAATRQVPIYVSIPNAAGQLVAGLFAEGRVVSQSATGLIVPLNTVNIRGPEPWTLRVRGGRTERVPVSLGLRDPRSERVEVTSGLADGDILLRGAAQGITPGTPVRITGGR
jgi:RND family efflux transporter MFP subunit